MGMRHHRELGLSPMELGLSPMEFHCWAIRVLVWGPSAAMLEFLWGRIGVCARMLGFIRPLYD
eukprot:3464899-Pyramimonas_sp.AAC.1